MRSADDAAPLGLPDLDLAPPDRLAVAVQLGRTRPHPTHAHRSGHGLSGRIYPLHFQADAHKSVAELARTRSRREVNGLGHPAHRRAHQASMPNARVNRTSPSTMSRMSAAELRN